MPAYGQPKCWDVNYRTDNTKMVIVVSLRMGVPEIITVVYLPANDSGPTVPGYDTHACPFIRNEKITSAV